VTARTSQWQGQVLEQDEGGFAAGGVVFEVAEQVFGQLAQRLGQVSLVLRRRHCVDDD
jgi:hypothetical protein